MTLVFAAIFIVSVLVQALLSGYETGFVSSNPIRIRYLAEEVHLKLAARLLRYMHRPEQMLTTLLIGINVSTMAGAIALSRELGELVATLIATPVFLIVADIIPKSVFRTHPSRLTLAFLPIIQFFYTLLAPVAAPIAWVLRYVGKERQFISPLMSSLNDVRVLVDESADHGTIEREEQRMIHSVIDLQDKQAREIMVPRIDIEGLPYTATRRELLDLFVATGRSRIPVYYETIDTVLGVINAHDVLLDTDTDDEDMSRFVNDVMHVPDTCNLNDLFKAMKRAKQHLAIVTDEYGGTDGLITTEDILEQIFGDIQDEHDREESQLQQVGPDAYIVDARMSLEEAAEEVRAPLRDDDVDTVGGWLMHAAGRIPLQGEVITHGAFRATVLEGSPSHIAKIRLDILRGTLTDKDVSTNPGAEKSESGNP